jgi:signal transduction histidine kinase
VFRTPYLVALDVAAAVVLVGIVGYAAVDAELPSGHGGAEPLWVSAVAAMFVAGPIAVRRFAPLPALATSMAAMAVAILFGVIPLVAAGAPVSAVAMVQYTVARETPRRRSVLAFGACLGTSAVMMLADRVLNAAGESWSDSVFGLTFAGLLLFTAWTLGFTARERRRHEEESATRRAEQAVAEERLRIARELHDIVAHSMSVIAVKAGIGNHVAEQRPAEAREALRVIEATSRGSLTEMRHLLGVLRSEVDSAELAPAPSAAEIPVLVERARSAGVVVSLSLADTSGVPEGAALSVYRIAQEALTNVVRHAAPTRCAVTVAVSEDDVRVDVVNEGPRVLPGAGGHGLIGMRERVAMYGGTFTAGPRAEGGWQVSAVLPL